MSGWKPHDSGIEMAWPVTSTKRLPSLRKTRFPLAPPEYPQTARSRSPSRSMSPHAAPAAVATAGEVVATPA